MLAHMHHSAFLFFLLTISAPALRADPAPPTLSFRIDEGRNLNSFVRQGPVAAHLLLRSGDQPRILVAFPAGNSGVGLWFEKSRPVNWTLASQPKPIHATDSRQRPLYGIEFDATVDMRELVPSQAVLSSVRVLRDYELLRKVPTDVLTTPLESRSNLTWSRDRLDGAPGYRLTIEGLDGTQVTARRWTAPAGAPMKLRIRALSGETPLVPVDSPYSSAAAPDTRARNALAFLSYEDKFLAGSWRFNTYFGRDTLISAALLAPVLEPRAMEGAIDSVLDRLAPNGEVAHEEDIGEFAVLRNAREGRGRTSTPIHDYGMVDDDFLLAPLAARWLLDDPQGRERGREFLARRGADGKPHGVALARNLVWLVEATRTFAKSPRATNLIGIKPGRMTGNWRDSEQGLGRGRFAYDVNAALVPAALEAAARIHDAKLLDTWLTDPQRRALASARDSAHVWSTRAAPLFEVDLPASRARSEIEAYARDIGVDPGPAVQAMTSARLEFHALSLDAQGKPVPVLQSDEGFRLLLTTPSAVELDRCLDAILLPFPAGLMTEAGMLVANPAFADAGIEREFSRFAYHGTVVWSWQQALMAEGLARQLERDDLPRASRDKLRRARAQLWAVIDRSNEVRTSELWSWSFDQGRYRIEPFGKSGADADESNAAQLWSTVYLGIERID
jgi:hypothetical protein